MDADQHAQAFHKHAPAPHDVRHPAEVHKEHLANASPIDRFIHWIIHKTATVQGIIVFFGIGMGSLVGIVTGIAWLAGVCGAVSSYILQLVYLALLLRSQEQSDAARDVQSDAIYMFGKNAAHEGKEAMHHLDAQDVHILAIETEHGEMLRQIIAFLTLRAGAPAPAPVTYSASSTGVIPAAKATPASRQRKKKGSS